MGELSFCRNPSPHCNMWRIWSLDWSPFYFSPVWACFAGGCARLGMSRKSRFITGRFIPAFEYPLALQVFGFL